MLVVSPSLCIFAFRWPNMHNPDFCYIKFYRENAGGRQSERQNAGRGRGGEAWTGNTC